MPRTPTTSVVVTFDMSHARAEVERLRSELEAASELMREAFPFARVTIEIDEQALVDHVAPHVRASVK